MGWLRKILKGSASNSRIQSNNSEDGDWDEPRDLLDEALDSEREEALFASTLSSAEENEAEEDQRTDDGQSGTGNEQFYKTSHLVNEDERLTEALTQSLVFNSNPLGEVENMFPHFPFSISSMDRQRSTGRCEDDERCSSSDEPNDMEDESTEGEDEETDYQMAGIRSVSEDAQGILIQLNGECHAADDLYGMASTEDWLQCEKLKMEDEDLAQSFQQNLSFESSSSSDIASIFRPFLFSLYPDNESSSPFDIASIFQPFPFSFYPDNRQAFRHPECVHSYASDGQLTNHEVFDSEDHSIYHNIDKDTHLDHLQHQHRRRPTCFVCGQPIPVDANGRLLFRRDPFSGQKYCRAHKRDGTPSCYGCKRLKPGGSTYSTLNDGRRLCPECRSSAVMDDRAFKPLEREMREFFESLGMKVHQRTIPLYLVYEQEMEESKEPDDKKGHHRLDGTEGLTTYGVRPIYTTVEGRRHALVAHSKVVSIKVLYGLPRLLNGQILAHEMMHAWHVLEMDGYLNMSLEVKEGLCQVLSHMWLGSQIRSMSKSKAPPSPQLDFQKWLAKFLRHRIESRTDYPYGTGFRLVKRATDMHGLKGTLDHIRMTGKLS